MALHEAGGLFLVTMRSDHCVGRGLGFAQVRIFLSWMQWLLRVCLPHVRHVLVNMDETSLTYNMDIKKGWVVNASLRDGCHMAAAPSRPTGAMLHCSLLAAATPNAAVQPYLPQVVLMRCKRAAVPRRLLGECAQTGAPLEWWHGTNGWASHVSMRHYATRLRSVVQSVDEKAWTVLVLDCATCHIDVRTLRHLRLLGIIIIFVPTGLTYLLQPCDVGVFQPLKQSLRTALLTERMQVADGTLTSEQWVRCVGSVLHSALVRVDWAACFGATGLTASYENLNEEIAEYLAAEGVAPRLPTLPEFAAVLSRSPETLLTQTLYRLVLSPQLALSERPPGTAPPPAATFPLEAQPPAQKRRKLLAELPADDLPGNLRRHLRDRFGVFPVGAPPAGEARNFFVPVEVAEDH